jgi:hypothetical protein
MRFSEVLFQQCEGADFDELLRVNDQLNSI